jgi:hypothetical protein
MQSNLSFKRFQKELRFLNLFTTLLVSTAKNSQALQNYNMRQNESLPLKKKESAKFYESEIFWQSVCKPVNSMIQYLE